MIVKAWRRIVGILRSAWLVVWLLAVVGAWVTVATVIPQATSSGQQVAQWAAAHPLLEQVVRVLGLHQAFTAPLFIVFVLLLAASTAVCAWHRTKVAVSRARMLHEARAGQRVAAVRDLQIACSDTASEAGVLDATAAVFQRLGIRVRRKGFRLQAISPTWSVWGSPLFHWALLALLAVLLVGNLQRSDGLMGLAVGQTKPDAPDSYGVLHSGPLRNWASIHRSLRVDSFDPDLRIGSLDYGPTPTVSVLDGTGRAIKTQAVYPNLPLRTGSLTIHSPVVGLSATISVTDTSGVELGRTPQLVDFSNLQTGGGTTPVGYLVVGDSAGAPQLKVVVTIPLDRSGGRYVLAPPSSPSARLVVTSLTGQTVVDKVVKPGEGVPLPVGGTLRLVDVGWYARLSVVDDGSIPFLYVVLAAAIIGLTITVVARQQIVLATVVDTPDGTRLAVQVRIWRNASTSRSEIESELSRALGADDKDVTK